MSDDDTLGDGKALLIHTNGQDWMVSWHLLPDPPDPPEGLPHGSAGICITGNGEIVLISANGTDWDLPAGRTEPGETWEETLRREMHEEACAIVTDARLLGFVHSECIMGHEKGRAIVRSFWRAHVLLGEWKPEFEISHRRVVPADEALPHLSPVYMPIFRRAFHEAGIERVSSRPSQRSDDKEPLSDSNSGLHEAMRVYFAAKARMFATVPAFRLLNVGSLMCFHNHPGWPEVDGFYAVDGETPPPNVISTIRAYQPAPDHMVTVFTASPDSILRSYEAWGYQPLPDPQPFMCKPLAATPLVNSAEDTVAVSRVETHTDMDFINSSEMVMEPAHLNDPLYRYYYVVCDGLPACWGRCIVVSAEAIYIAGMETAPEYRRRGLATALMNRMHTDAMASGATQSVLCSTTVGLGLYTKVGYTLLGYMQAFVPQATKEESQARPLVSL